MGKIMSELVSYTLKGNVAEVQLQNGKVNAFSPEFIDAINGALDQAEKDEAAVLFVGNPGVFSAGFDLKIVKAGNLQDTADMMVAGGTLCARMLEFPRPIVSAVTGHCMAQGVMFLLACDYSVAVDGDFTLGLNETQIGMVIPQYGIELAKGRFPKHVWQRAVTHAELYSPAIALELGLVDQVAEDDALMDVARAETQRLADLDKRAFKGNKQRMRQEQIAAMREALAQDGSDILTGVAG